MISVRLNRGRHKNAKEITKYWKINMMKIDPWAKGFTSGFSQEHTYSTVGEQITVEHRDENGAETDGTECYHICFHNFLQKRK